jgi:hypothetical protein
MIADFSHVLKDCECLRFCEIILHVLSCQNKVVLIELVLGWSKVAKNDELIPVWQIAFDLKLLFRPPKNVTIDNLSQLMQALLRSLDLNISGVGKTTLYNGLAKGILEIVKLTKKARLYKIEQAPKFLETILHRCPRQY